MRCVFAAIIAAMWLVGSAGAAKRPAIEGTDVLTGRHVALSQYQGKPVFVNVWGSWCYGCQTEGPTLARFVKAHAHQVEFLGIDTSDTKQGARKFCARYGLRYPSIFDPRALLAGAWSRGAPTLLVFDRRHVFLRRIEGTASAAQLNAALKQVTSTRP